MRILTGVSLSVVFVVVLTVSVLSASAQTETATVSGRVTDSQGQVVPDVQIQLVNIDTNIAVSTKTNSQGLYNIPNVRPGQYRILVVKDGFKEIVKTGLVLHVQDIAAENFALQVGSISESVTVTSDQLHINTTDASVGTVIDRDFVTSLPLNGRSFNTLLQLTPGVVIVPVFTSGSIGGSVGQFSIAGQRADSNNFNVDGVSANFGVSALSSPTSSGTGSAPAFSVLGGTSSLVSVDTLQEFRVETSSFAPEFGRQPGGQIILTTRSGTNDLHGGLFDYFRNDAMDANDWFANTLPTHPHAPERHNDFGGFLGGPILKNRTFLFLSYEGARLRLPRTARFHVPSEFARQNAPAAVAPYLKAYPEPDDRTVTPGVYTGQFTGSSSQSATLDAGSIRIDHSFSDRFSIFGRYNYAPSDLQQIAGEPNNPSATVTNTQTLTVGVNMVLSPRLYDAVRGNYSTQKTSAATVLNSFGGAVPLNPTLLLAELPASDSTGSFSIFDTGFISISPGVRNRTRQLNFVDDLAVSVGKHQLKFGGDDRAIYLDAIAPLYGVGYSAFSVQSLIATGQASFFATFNRPFRLLAQSFSAYSQDSWKVSPRLTLTYGLRWELAPAPSARGNTTLASWTNTNNPSQLALAPLGTPLWNTTYGNFAPRAGVAYGLTRGGDLVLRAGWGLYYDLGVGQSASQSFRFPNTAVTPFFPPTIVTLPVSNLSPCSTTVSPPCLPVISLQPPFSNAAGIASDLRLPRSYEWNVALEKSFAGKQAISATYVGHAGRDLLRMEGLPQPNANFAMFSDFLLTNNSARSNYNALQLQYRRPLSARVQALLNYTWSHSLDNVSDDTFTTVSDTVISGLHDYASSGFDVRHSFSGAVLWNLPAASRSGPLFLLSRDWSLDTIVVARSGFPFNAAIVSVGPPGGAFSRPNLTGKPFWIPDPSAGGGKSLNPAAFTPQAPGTQGTEGRNDIRGFGLTQVDLSIARKFTLTEQWNLQFRADAFNAFNHPNFTNPIGLVDPFFGTNYLKSPSMLNSGLGGLNPLFQEGGPRSLQLSLRLTF